MSQYFTMGGYGLYVWGSVGIAVAVMLWNVAAPALHRRDVLRMLVDKANENEMDESA